MSKQTEPRKRTDAEIMEVIESLYNCTEYPLEEVLAALDYDTDANDNLSRRLEILRNIDVRKTLQMFFAADMLSWSIGQKSRFYDDLRGSPSSPYANETFAEYVERNLAEENASNN